MTDTRSKSLLHDLGIVKYLGFLLSSSLLLLLSLSSSHLLTRHWSSLQSKHNGMQRPIEAFQMLAACVFAPLTSSAIFVSLEATGDDLTICLFLCFEEG